MPGGIVPPEDLPGGLVPPDDLPSQGGALTRLARMPRAGVEALGEKAGFPTVGKVAGAFVPDTPAQWGALAGLTAAQAIPGVGQLGLLARLGGSALGAAGGSIAGGETDPLEVAKESGIAAAGQALGEGAGKVIGAAAGHVGRQLKGGVQKLLDDYGAKLTEIIPGIATKKFTPTHFADVVMGGKGDKALSDAYSAGVNEIKNLVGPNAYLQNPTITGIIKKYLPEAAPTITQMSEPLRRQGATAPAHLVLNPESQPIALDAAMKAAQEIGARARLVSKRPEGEILGREMRQANEQLRTAISEELNRVTPGAGDVYQQINDSFRRGSRALDLLKENVDTIFLPGTTKPKIDTAELARVHNLAAGDLERAGLGDLAPAARRGAPIGAGDVEAKIPGSSLFFGDVGGLRGRLSKSGVTIPVAAGQPNTYPSPLISGPAGQLTLSQLLEELKKRQEQFR